MFKTSVLLLALFISALVGGLASPKAADAQSSAIPCTNLAVNLKYPMTDAATGGAVTLLQSFLKASGYLAATPNGTFGPQTRNAVGVFQRQYNIPASPAGYVGPLTREKIREISCTNTGSNTGTGTGTGTGSTGGTVAGTNQAIWISSPGASRNERYIAGSNFVITIENLVPNPTSNPNLMSYNVDLVRGDTVFQRFGTIYATAAGKKTVNFTLSPSLNKDFYYRIKVTPSCTSLASMQCRQALSNEFTILANDTAGQPFVDITTPTGGSYAAGLNLPIQASIPSDKVYSLAFYLVPQSGAALSGTGSYYDSVSGGYNIGGFVPNTAVSQVNTNMPVPSDMPSGTYKLRAYLRPSNETTGSPTQWSALAYDESATFTITSTNTGTNTGNPATLIPLATTQYKFLSYNGDFVPANTSMRMTFSSATGNGTVSGNICNSMYGSYARNGNVIASNMVATQMACSGMTMNIETAFLSMMAGGATISTEGNNIVLTRGSNRLVLGVDPLTAGGTGTTGSASINVLAPNGAATWKIGETQNMVFSFVGVPANAYLVVAISGGPSNGTLLRLPVPSSGSYAFNVPASVWNGDVGSQLMPGTYTVTASVYDKEPCLGNCAANWPTATLLATKAFPGPVTFTSATQTSTNPYLRVTAPIAGFAYASTSPDINMTWAFGNLERFRHYGFQVQLQNKLSPGQWEVMVPLTSVTATGTSVKITNEVINRFVQRSGKTKDQLKSSYFLKVFGLGYGTYPPNNTSYIDAESPTFTVTPW